MKTFFHLTGAFVLMSILVLNSCDVTKTESECDASNWSEAKEPMFNFYLDILAYNIYCNPSDTLHILRKAESLNFTGSVTKVYCSGDFGSTFPYNSIYYMNSEREIFTKIGQAYQFKFQNDKDYLSVAFKIKANFSDGQIYDGREVSLKIYYRDLLMDVNTGQHSFTEEIKGGDIVCLRIK
jgi:hypothetical protein